MSTVYDLIIAGAGPAGITAAVYASRKKLSFCVITKDIGGQAAWSGDIENYTGFQFITGPELTMKFSKHMESAGIELHMPEEITRINQSGRLLSLDTNAARYTARSIIVATGKRPRYLGVPGEKEFKNKGVTYCATCDGPLFADKPVAVIGGGNSALDAALQMMRISPKVYVINNASELTGDAVMREKLQSAAHVEILNGARVVRIEGDAFVKNIVVEHGAATASYAVAGVFVEIGLKPNTEFVSALACNQLGEISVDCRNATNVPGVFAAGDVTDVPEKQIIIACGEGSKAVLAAWKYVLTSAS